MKKYNLIDCFKLFFAIGIVGIHCNLFQGADNISWYILHGILRVGVPFFFCVSGFFFCKSLDNKGSLNKSIKRIAIPFVFWVILDFFTFYIRCSTYSGLSLFKIIIMNLLFYPWGAMWYLLALMISMLILYPFYKKNKLGLVVIIGAVLYFFGLIGNNYYFLIEGTKLQGIMEWYLNHFLCTRNALFEGLYFTGIGMYISRMKKIPSGWLLIGSYLLLVLEIFLIKGRTFLDDHSLYFSFIYFIPIFVLYLTQFKSDYNTVKVRNYSSGIYFIHRFIIGILTLVLGLNVSNILLFIITIIISFITLFICYKTKNKYILMVTK